MRRMPLHRALGSAASIVVCALVACTLALALLATPASADGGQDDLPPGWRLYDGGALLEPDAVPGAVPLELAIDYFTSGTPPVRWLTSASPVVTVCTVQTNRPGNITAAEFRESVERGVQVWSEAEAAIGFNYTGDCPTQSWSQNNGINEIGWDDARNVVRSPAAGVTFGRWQDRGFSRDFQETDIVLDHELQVSRQCLDSVVAHELGHVLGFGHSTAAGDLMFPSFDPSNSATCPGRPTAAEVALLQGLYGVNRTPVIASASLGHTAPAGATTTVRVGATDPEGDALTYAWTQLAGPPVAFTSGADGITFTAPRQPGATLRFRVAVRDRFFHTATAEVSVLLVESSGPPADEPYLEGLRMSSDGRRLALKFTESTGATQYRYCATPVQIALPVCQQVAAPLGEITWDTVLGAAVENEPIRVITTGLRDVKVQACNQHGCVQDDLTRILAGGVRWSAHRVDYDFFSMTQDLGAGDNKFTIAFVQNMAGAARDFRLYAGSAEDPRRTLMMTCRGLIPGDVCVGFLAPGDRGHGTHVTIRSERSGTPVIENQIRVR